MAIFQLLENLRPQFLKGERIEADHFRYLFNYPRLWQVAIALMATVAVVPLVCVTVFDYRVTQHALKSEILLRTSRLASNSKRSIAFFLEARKSALDFIVHDNDPETLTGYGSIAEDPGRSGQRLRRVRGSGGDRRSADARSLMWDPIGSRAKTTAPRPGSRKSWNRESTSAMSSWGTEKYPTWSSR